MENLPLHISIVFGLTTLLTIGIFYKATNNSGITLTILVAWITLQCIIGVTGFYTVTDTIPPRFLLMIAPPLLLIAVLFATIKGRMYIDRLSTKYLTLLHIVRLPVEIVLYWLFIYKAVPELMTFEGRNFDILAGLTAPVVFYFGFIRKVLDKNILLIWNFICLALLINIVVNAILSAPLPFQKFGYEQPNIAVMYFPFNWLPSCVVPLVLFSHLASIRHLLRGAKV